MIVFCKACYIKMLLLGAKPINLYFIWRVGIDLHNKPQIKKKFFITKIFSFYYCSVDLKRQSEHSRLRVVLLLAPLNILNFALLS